MNMSKTMTAALAVLALGMAGPAHGQMQSDPRTIGGAKLTSGFLLGLNGGFGGEAMLIAHDFAIGFPFDARASLAWTSVAPGDPAAARRIFINNATNGTPEKSGRTLDFSLDVMRPMRLFSNEQSWWFVGVRYSRFLADFRFIGGNEDFEVRSSHWGLGGGFESHYRLSRRLDLAALAGFDWLRPSRLSGHDTSYAPDGERVNPREDYTYSDADDAIGQPGYRPRFQLGIVYHHGG